MLHWLYHAISWTWGGDGQGGPNGTGYLISSGPASASGVLGALGVFAWGRLCYEPGCWRLARREDRHGHHVCTRHWRSGLPKPVWDTIPEIRELAEQFDLERR